MACNNILVESSPLPATLQSDCPEPIADYYLSHDTLLRPFHIPDPRTYSRLLDTPGFYLTAIPASRSADSLAPTISSLASMPIPPIIFVAHSDRLEQQAATRLLNQYPFLEYISAYIPPNSHLEMFGLQSDRFPLAVAQREHNNLACKRNLALVIAQSLRIGQICFLDDDIRFSGNQFYREKCYAHILPSYVAGLSNCGAPDRSAVHHAIGNHDMPFISGNALFISPNYSVFYPVPIAEYNFFPNIYNEDWLYMAPAVSFNTASRTGLVRQDSYDPFTPGRAYSEEFGDVIAEGIYAYLRINRYDAYAYGAGSDYWAAFLRTRQKILDLALTRTEKNDALCDTEKERRTQALIEARLANIAISATDCRRYLTLVRQDRKTWDATIAELTDPRLKPTPIAHLNDGRHEIVRRCFQRLGLPQPDTAFAARIPWRARQLAHEDFWIKSNARR